MKRRLYRIACLFLFLCCAASVRADYAIVVGVGKYENLPPGYDPLGGPPNDAREMKAALEAMDFKVKCLVDKEATKEGIMNALKAAQDRSLWKPTDRFVFYFAGHGTNVPQAILPYDTSWVPKRDENRSIITRAELKETIGKIPAGARTVILDSCFSAAMRSQNGDLIPRYISLDLNNRGGESERDDDPNGKDTIADTPANGSRPIRFLAAAQESEKAYERFYPLPGDKKEKRGIFSHNLIPRLKKELEKTPGELLVAQVSDAVNKESFRQQTPLHNLKPDEPLLGVASANPEAPSSPIPPGKSFDVSLWEMFLVERSDNDFVNLTVSPRKTRFIVYKTPDEAPATERIAVTVRAKKAGWVLVLARFADGRYQVIFPDPRKMDLDAAYVGEDESWAPVHGKGDSFRGLPLSDLGTITFKVIHISKQDEAKRIFSKLRQTPDSGRLTEASLKDFTIQYYPDFRLFTKVVMIQGITPEEAAKIAAEKEAEKKQADAKTPEDAKDHD